MLLQAIKSKIYEVRGLKVMFDFDLASMYNVENRVLKQAVKRNLDRFPEDFMFHLKKTEWNVLITNCDNLPETIKHSPTPPFAFTEQGVAMLSTVLRSKKALQVNIAIMRAFVVLRQYALSHKDLSARITELEVKFNKRFKDVFDAINYLLELKKSENDQKNRKRIGYNR